MHGLGKPLEVRCIGDIDWDVLLSHLGSIVKFIRPEAAENLLKRGGLNYTHIASELMDTRRFPSHSQMIGYETAKEIGLNITYMPSEDPIWRRYWDLYCLLRLTVKGNQKLFESALASLPLDI